MPPARTASNQHSTSVPLELTGAPAKIVSVNGDLGFVVIDFTTQALPSVGTKLNIYRGDKQVGVVRVTEPARAPLATADVVEGQMRPGDEAR